jgi:hypothetical protein
MKYGEVGNVFYLMIKGEVEVKIPNLQIKSWMWAKDIHNTLKEWKLNEFDPFVKEIEN